MIADDDDAGRRSHYHSPSWSTITWDDLELAGYIVKRPLDYQHFVNSGAL